MQVKDIIYQQQGEAVLSREGISDRKVVKYFRDEYACKYSRLDVL